MIVVPGKDKISVIIPVFDSQETIGGLIDELVPILGEYVFEIILVDDCSHDRSREICMEKCEQYRNYVKYFRLSKNFGEHSAVIAGLNQAVGEFALIMDDDFQNPPEEVPKIIEYMFKNKFDVLYTYYDEKKHSYLRNAGSRFNNWVFGLLLKKPKSLYLSSFKCINRFIINEIIKYRGPYPYIDGLILRVTSNIGQILVVHHERRAGKSKYTIRKLIALWINMFVNFSVAPLRISFLLGGMLAFSGLTMVLFFLIDIYLLHPQGPLPSGWLSLLVSIIIFSGAQLMFLGLIGEYIGRLFLSDNGTPQFVIREHYGR